MPAGRCVAGPGSLGLDLVHGARQPVVSWPAMVRIKPLQAWRDYIIFVGCASFVLSNDAGDSFYLAIT
ncbi:MAG: hypothetical protein NTX37_08280 [Burkholderiales bacterium]|jgi:hypothetical protein|nr:hypothetical protein [Burkholderiales bacterium]